MTLIQPGSRLGGKGATHRDPSRGQAILEHGLHMWLGWYRTAFTMIEDVYGAWDGPRHGPQRSLETAFSPQFDVSLIGGAEDTPEVWHLRCPETPGKPWDHAGSAQTWLQTAATWARRLPAMLIEGGGDASAPKMRTMASLTAAVVRGIAVERTRHGDDMWSAMDDLDLRAWLRKHGATDAAACSPPIRGLYDLGFAYPDGITGRDRGAAAAGTSLRVLLNMFASYRGAPFWRMNAGMGDTIFAPAYEVLRDRGVDFRFFQKVTALRTDGSRITRVEVSHQAKGAEGYRPLVDIGDIRAWPGEPLVDQLQAVAEGDLETGSGPGLSQGALEVGEDFDEVVLAIPATAQRSLAADLMAANPRYARMVQHTHGVATIAAQWWLERTTRQLGWSGENAVLTGLPGLFGTWADLSELVDAEAWDERPASLAYLCGVAPPELQRSTNREEAAAWVAAGMREWSPELVRHWPGAAVRGRLDEGALKGGWETQYARANVADWERYILSLPGTTRHRLAPGDSGFDNLALAGDWTENRVNGGSVEGAVDSGVNAAAAVITRA